MSDRFVSFAGILADANAAIGLIKYAPDENFNSAQHAELITVAIWQTESTEAKVRVRPAVGVAHKSRTNRSHNCCLLGEASCPIANVVFSQNTTLFLIDKHFQQDLFRSHTLKACIGVVIPRHTAHLFLGPLWKDQ